jgi:hypothetical protein
MPSVELEIIRQVSHPFTAGLNQPSNASGSKRQIERIDSHPWKAPREAARLDAARGGAAERTLPCHGAR